MKYRGIGLIELLMALVVSSMLMMLLMGLYVSIKQHYQVEEQRIENAMDMRLLVDLLRDRIHQAGFTPCMGIEHLSSVDTRTGRTDLPAYVLNTSDAPGFQVNHMSARYGLIVAYQLPERLRVISDRLFIKAQSILISDCFHAEVHTIKDVQVESGYQELHLDKPIQFTYHSPSYIGEWIEERFFFRHAVNTLFYARNRVDAVSEGILNMRVSIDERDPKPLFHIELKRKHLFPVRMVVRPRSF